MRSHLFNVVLVATLTSPGIAIPAVRFTAIVKDQSSAPIAGASASLISVEGVLRSRSSVDGSLAFDDVPSGAYELDVSAPDFVRRNILLDLHDNTAQPRLAIELRPSDLPKGDPCHFDLPVTYDPPGSRNSRLAGVIRDLCSPAPIANAEVTIRLVGDHPTIVRSRSDRTGRFSFEDVPPGYYDLQITKPGYQPYRIDRVIKPREHAVTVDAELLRKGVVIVSQ